MPEPKVLTNDEMVDLLMGLRENREVECARRIEAAVLAKRDAQWRESLGECQCRIRKMGETDEWKCLACHTVARMEAAK